MKPRKDGGRYEGKALSLVYRQQGENIAFAQPCGAEKPAHTAGQIRGLRGRDYLQGSQCPDKESEN